MHRKALKIGLLSLLLSPDPSQAHNGAFAHALPVQGIRADGDLADWPADRPRFPLALLKRHLTDGPTDFQAQFSAGYNTAENALYIAVEIDDQSEMLEHDDTLLWSYHKVDGGHLFVSEHHPEQTPTARLGLYGDKKPANTGNFEAAVRRQKGRATYEWRVNTAELDWQQGALKAGKVLSFDLVFFDRDADGSISELHWGNYEYKQRNARSRGDLLLVGDQPLGRAQGKVTWTRSGRGGRGLPVRFQNLDQPGQTFIARTDPQGNFAVPVPAGRYTIKTLDLDRNPNSTPAVIREGKTTQLHLPAHPPRGRTVDVGLGHRQGSWQNFTTEDGLPDDSVISLTQDSDGQLWVSTADGLCRFDGAQFNIYTPDNGLPSYRGFMGALAADAEGGVWLSTYFALARIDSAQWDIFTPSNKLSNTEIGGWLLHDILVDGTGDLWTTSDKTLARYTDTGFARIDTAVETMGLDRQGGLWIVAEGQLKRRQGEAFEVVATHDSLLANGTVRSIVEDLQGNLWIGGTGAKRFNGKSFTHFTAAEGLPDDHIKTLSVDQEGLVWLGTKNGLSCYDGTAFKNFTSREGLPGNEILSLLVDSGGNLWVGSTSGLSRYSGHRLSALTEADGLLDNRVNSLIEDRRGHFWFGTPAGLSRFAPEGTSNPKDSIAG